MTDFVPIGDEVRRALATETGFTVAKTKEPKPCARCGVPQEPVVFPELDLTIDRPPVCEACRDKEAAAKAQEEEAYRRANVERELLLSDVPIEFVKYSFTGNQWGTITWPPESKRAVAICMAFAMKAEGGLILTGKAGRGKTHLAVSMLREMIIRGYKTRFVSCAALADALRAVYRARPRDEEDESERDVLNRVGRGVILLDDLGASRATPMVVDALTSIVDRCEQRGQPLILTTNLSLPEIGKRYDERLASRLAGLCGTPDRVLLIDGPDYRTFPRR